MSIKGFRIVSNHQEIRKIDFHSVETLCEDKFYSYFCIEYSLNSPDIIQFDTGVYDREGISIYVGDTLRQKSCETPFVVEDIVSFLIMCGRYEEKHGTPIFDSLEIVNE